jgi:hypothetical protein
VILGIPETLEIHGTNEILGRIGIQGTNEILGKNEIPEINEIPEKAVKPGILDKKIAADADKLSSEKISSKI